MIYLRRIVAIVALIVGGALVVPVLILKGTDGVDWVFDRVVEPVMEWAGVL